jgi:thiosulfate/3-mercaptopyruvate sulfurtransferase
VIGTDLALRIVNGRFPLLAGVLVLVVGCGREAPQSVVPVNSPDAANAAPETSDDVDSVGPAEVPTAAEPLAMLVSVELLQEQLDNSSVRILDVRSQAEYDAGHILFAVLIDANAWTSLTLKDGGAGLHDQTAWSTAVGEIGVDGATQVVVYSSSPTSAARIWWILKYVGVEKVGILDGGWNAWKASDAETSMETPDLEPLEFEARFQDDRLSLIGDLEESHSSDDIVVVDARSADEYLGEGISRGRIPGAVLLEWKDLLTEAGRYKPKDELIKLFELHRITPEKTVITHCQTGGRASVNVFALELAGYGKVKNYYCGWGEWSQDEAAPREQGVPKPQ